MGSFLNFFFVVSVSAYSLVAGKYHGVEKGGEGLIWWLDVGSLPEVRRGNHPAAAICGV
jgi:hypothetical protein